MQDRSFSTGRGGESVTDTRATTDKNDLGKSGWTKVGQIATWVRAYN